MTTRVLLGTFAGALALGLGVLTGCGGQSSASGQSMRQWSQALAADPAWTAVNNELGGTNLSESPADCKLAANDTQALLDNHKPSPVDEADWSKVLRAMHAEVTALCANDLNTAITDAAQAASSLGAFTATVQRQVPGWKF